MANSLRTSVDVSLTPRQAFDTLVDELTLALNDRGMKFTPSSAGKMLEGDVEVGTIQEWIPGDRISILWHPKTWQAGTTSRLLIKFKAHNEGTSVVVEHEGWDRVLGDTGQELLGWFAGEVVTPMIASSAPARLGDWITDRRARRPSGAQCLAMSTRIRLTTGRIFSPYWTFLRSVHETICSKLAVEGALFSTKPSRAALKHPQ